MKSLIVVIFIIALFSIYRLGTESFNVDAQHWMPRSSNFARKLVQGQFAQTFQDPKPGVPVMLLSGTSLETFLMLYEAKYGFRPLFYTFDTFPYLNFVAKIPLVLLNLGFLTALYFLLKRLLSHHVALLTIILVGLQPFYLANSRFLHVDITLTVFMNLCFVLYLYGLQCKKVMFVALSGICAGLALLTKTQALFLFPLIFLTTGFYYVFQEKNLKELCKKLSLWLAFTFTSYFLLFPAFWVDFKATFTKIMQEAFFVVETGNTSVKPFWYYFIYLSKDLSLIGLVLLLVALAYLLYKAVKVKEHRFVYLSILSFVVFYFLQMSIIKQKVDRYMLPAYPMMALSVSIFLLSNKYVKSFKRKNIMIVSLLIMCSSIALFYAPHYTAFAIKGLDDNYSGALYSEVGRYINSKPNAKEAKVVVMTKTASLRPFISGKTYGHEEPMPKGWSAEYLVTNDHRLWLYGKPKFFEKCQKEHTVNFRGKTFWDIYACK